MASEQIYGFLVFTIISMMIQEIQPLVQNKFYFEIVKIHD